METEAGARSSGRPRSWLLGALGVAIAAYAYTLFAPGNSVAPRPAQSNAPRTVAPKAAKAGGPIAPVDLQVRLADQRPHPDADKAGAIRSSSTCRRPHPHRPSSRRQGAGGGSASAAGSRYPTASLPRDPGKFIGVLQTKAGERIAAFSDCQKTWRGREGEVVAGQYRLLKIGVESVQMEYLDHRGQATIRMSGQDCIGR